MDYRDDKKRINLVLVDPKVFDTLIKMANEQGMHIGEFAGEALSVFVSEKGQEKMGMNGSPESRVHWMYVSMKNKQAMRDKAYAAAAIYNGHQTEENADILDEICELAEVDKTDLLMKVGRDPFSSIVAESRGTKHDSCVEWLGNLLLEHPKGISVEVLRKLAGKEGYSNTMLNRVKRDINDREGMSVESQKRGKIWWWILTVDGLSEEKVRDMVAVKQEL